MSDDLIARLTAGERWGGDNAEVLKALGWKPVYRQIGTDPAGNARLLPRPLDSVDNALRLVPEGWRVLDLWDHGDEWTAELYLSGAVSARSVEGAAPTAAIALTIAILEASRG